MRGVVMKELIASPVFARNAQIVLLFAYALLAIIFAQHKKTWPVSLYYFGCLVKDAGVFALAFLMKWFN